MVISVICPVLNEGKNIQGLIDFFLASRPAEKELFLIDGGSKDDTIKIISENTSRSGNIHLIHNPNKIVPFALNLGIPKCTGSIIVRLDGHSTYGEDYFEKILEAFEKSGADIVGGPTRTHFTTPKQEAIAYVVSHPFGIGGSKVHQENFEGWTDFVTFGAWKKNVFDKIGMFDEQLIRNQDDEFHYRANAAGLKVYQYPPIKLYYFPRASLTGLWKQYFEYGLYKPLVLRKVKSGIQARHLAPSIFVLYLITLIFFLAAGQWLMLGPVALYGMLSIVFSLSSGTSFTAKMWAVLCFPIVHISYGAGCLIGLRKLI